MLEHGRRGRGDLPAHHRDQRHRHLLRDARGPAADAAGGAASSSPPRSGEDAARPISPPTSPPSTPISASCGCWRRSSGRAASGSTPSARAGCGRAPRCARSAAISEAAGIGEDEMLGQILAAQALPGLMEPDDVAEPLPLPRLRPRTQHHRPGGQCRPRGGDGVSGRSPASAPWSPAAPSGIGRAIALALAAEGARVAIADRGAEGPDRQGCLRRIGGGIRPAYASTSPTRRRCWSCSTPSCRASAASTSWSTTPASCSRSRCWRRPPRDFDRLIGVNLRGVFLVGREAHPRHVGARAAVASINIASELAYLGRENCLDLLRVQGRRARP